MGGLAAVPEGAGAEAAAQDRLHPVVPGVVRFLSLVVRTTVDALDVLHRQHRDAAGSMVQQPSGHLIRGPRGPASADPLHGGSGWRAHFWDPLVRRDPLPVRLHPARVHPDAFSLPRLVPTAPPDPAVALRLRPPG